MVATSACGPGPDTFVTLLPRLDHFARGRPSLLAMRWPRATGLTSYLSGCLSLTSRRCHLGHRRPFERFSPSLPCSMVFPAPGLLLSRLSASFVWPTPSRGPPESPGPCWLTVATVYPLGNCDWPRARNRPGLLGSARSGFSSLLAAQLLFRVTDGARTPPEELVNSASSTRGFRHELSRERANQPGPLFPQLPGIILGG